MTHPSERELIRAAITVLRDRATAPEGYHGLTPAAAGGLCRTLTGIADSAPELDLVDRGHAVCLAHRILDDDHPADSPMWPVVTSEVDPTAHHSVGTTDPR